MHFAGVGSWDYQAASAGLARRRDSQSPADFEALAGFEMPADPALAGRKTVLTGRMVDRIVAGQIVADRRAPVADCQALRMQVAQSGDARKLGVGQECRNRPG